MGQQVLPKQASRRISKKRKISDTNFAAVGTVVAVAMSVGLAALRPDVTIILSIATYLYFLAQSRAAESGIKCTVSHHGYSRL